MTTFDVALDPKIDKYAIYLRKSRADLDAEKDGEEETLARHKKILFDLAARKELFIGEVYQEVVSGDTIDARPEIQRLITDCYEGKYKGILIVEVTRLSRGNQGDAQKIIDCLKYSNKNNGVLVITPTKTYDVAHNQEDEEYMEFELFMSRREYRMINKRMDRGRKQAVVEGNYMGSYRPYGYDIVKKRKTRTLTPNPDEAPIVKKIYEWAVNDGLSNYKIAQRLTNMGVPTYRNESNWSKETVKTILLNPTYMGKVRWNDRMIVKSMVDGELKSSRPRNTHGDQYMLYDGKHIKDALVSEEMYNAALRRYKADKTKVNYRLVNPLAGLLFCEKCGKSMAYQSYKHKKGSVQPRYVHKDSFTCNVKSVTANDVMNALIHALKLYIEDFEFKVEGMPEVDEKDILLQKEMLQKEIDKVNRRIDVLFDKLEEELIDNNDFARRKAMHLTRIAKIKEQLEELEDSIPEKIEYEDKIYKLHDALDALLNDDLDAEIKNDHLKRLLDKITFSRENDGEFILDITLR